MTSEESEPATADTETASALGLIRRHARAFVTFNAGYYGLVFAGMLIGGLNPSIRDILSEAVKKAVTEGPLQSVGSAYGSGKFLWAFVLTFLINLIAGSLLTISVPSAIIPFSGLLLAAWRAILWGLLFTPVHHPLGLGLYVHYVTLLLEGQAYILAAFAAYLHGRSFLAPQSMGATSHGQGYVLGIKHSAHVYLFVTVLLLVAALYESFTGVYIIPALLPA